MVEGADKKGRELVFRVDQVNEQVVLAAALVGAEFRKDAVKRHRPDCFLTQEHRVAWQAIQEAEKRGLGCDPATLNKLAGGEVDVAYLVELVGARPDCPPPETLAYHVGQLLWDRQRHQALTGPVSGLLESIQQGEQPERVRGLARAVAQSFDGWGDRRYLHGAEALVASQVADLRARMAGRAVFPFGLKGLDRFDDNTPRIIPGARPGGVTVVTGVPGSGKSTVTARIVLGLARQKRKVLFGAWEMTGGTTLELLAIQSLGLSRSAVTMGAIDEEQLRQIEQRMLALSEWVTFLANPFRRGSGGERPSNERNLDIVQGYIADSGCEVFVADLWKRCLARADPDDEEEALYRQQAMAEELQVHVCMVQQQRLKDIESRPDKRPTREGIKGSGAWVEVPDNIFGIHRPALWKAVPDNVLEVDILKQRYGRWPLAIEFDWDADRGMVSGGRHIEYDQGSSPSETSNPIDQKIGGKGGRWRK